MKSSVVAILLLFSLLPLQALAASEPESETTLKIRNEAVQVAQLLRKMSRIQSLNLNSEIEDIVRARLDLRAFQTQIDKRFAHAQRDGGYHHHTMLSKASDFADKTFKAVPAILGLSLAAYAAYRGTFWVYHHSYYYLDHAQTHSFSEWWDTARSSGIETGLGATAGIFLGVAGGAVVGFSLEFLRGSLHLERLGYWLRNRSSREAFFEELKKESIAVPESNQEQWLGNALNQVAQELFVARSPKLIETQLRLLQQLLEQARVSIRGHDSHLVPVVEGMIEALRAQTSWKEALKKKFFPTLWAEESYVRFIQVRSKFLELAEELEFEKAGFDWRKELSTMTRDLDSQMHGTQKLQVLLAEDTTSQRFLDRVKDELFSTNDVLELYGKLEDPLKVSIKVRFEEGQKPGPALPVGLAKFEVTLTLPDGTKHVVTAKAPARSTDPSRLALEDGWVAPVKAALQREMRDGALLPRILEACDVLLTKTRVSADATPGEEAKAVEEAQALEAEEAENIEAKKQLKLGFD